LPRLWRTSRPAMTAASVDREGSVSSPRSIREDVWQERLMLCLHRR
jgi:hypothetical protein